MKKLQMNKGNFPKDNIEKSYIYSANVKTNSKYDKLGIGRGTYMKLVR